MTSEDSRQKSRRRLERRANERRRITHKFGSPAWINAVKQNYLLWPKQDRRVKDNRSQERRRNYRRIKHLAHTASIVKREQLHNLLTEEEKIMLNELMQSE
ncbi:hypothetical protein [methanotrophic endosymbiont of Bathymodiolus puteoserpentis (Logatchev)]|jgi:hypothetical protein|uniref:hypothetical protein n=1 Tax=methanotrophic endosymbiont of Bathymodiolus puteoserpentis (Logatchev) TaxID=343235 RepID=UPI0013C63C9A|nr:hypothetical protein [methanotrophic endosymbiont of Bathymodiolus puteoserpentis (Logatchev)]SHE21925.1 hypothetical protein BPUTEOMOX_2520 [methanotrophic endosymbiont of Bathymodiolus puteoserpentis (Logatchev)]